MLNKKDLIQALERGGYISIETVNKKAHVYNADGDYLDVCRFDTATRIEAMPGYMKCDEDGAFYRIKHAYFLSIKEKPKQTVKTLYVNMSTIRTETTTSAAKAMEWHRAGDVVRVDRGYKYTDIPGAKQPYKEDENRAHCRHIANELEAYQDGRVYSCPDCGETFELPDDVGDKFRCPCCHAVNGVDDLEQLSLYDYLSDVFDVEYRVGSDKEFRSVRIMVACGGPNIYIDTRSRCVELYWWNETACYSLLSETVDALNDWAEELWGCC